MGVILFGIFSHPTLSQEDFEDELEAELQSELTSGEIEVESESDSTEGDPQANKDDESEISDEELESELDDEFSDEDFDSVAEEDVSDEDFEGFSDEDFADSSDSEEDQLDFSELENELDQEEQDSPSMADGVPVEEDNLDTATEEIDLEPLEESSPEVAKPLEPVMPEPEETPIYAQEQVPDEDTGPNLEYEASLYNIYINYHNSPTAEGEWLALLGSRKSEVYGIEKKDTLWGISEVFFGDGNYWPKIWSFNNKIGNPHLIKEGNQIQFIMGDLNQAPAFSVSPVEKDSGGESNASPESEEIDAKVIQSLLESGAISDEDAKSLQSTVSEPEPTPTAEAPVAEAKVDTGTPQAEQKEYQEPDIEIPPPTFVSQPVLKRLPPSVPEWQIQQRKGEYDELGVSYKRRPIQDLKDEIYLSSYIDEKDVISDAEVLEIETGGRIAWENQYIYAKFPKDKGEPGQKYLVIQNQGELQEANDHILSSELGYQKNISGLVTIGEKVDADVDQKKYDVYRAFVEKAISPISLGSELVKGKLPIVSLEERGATIDVVGQIIGGSLDRRRSVFGKASIIYIDRGISDGVSDGNILPIRANRNVRTKESFILENQRVIGKAKVIKASDHFSTAVVISSIEDIRAGDFTGKGRFLPRLIDGKVKKKFSGNESNDFEETSSQVSELDDENIDDELETLLNEDDDTDELFDDTSEESDFDF